MSDAPERIWAWAWEVDRHRGGWSEVQEIVGEGSEYVRADLHAAVIALAERAEAERDRFEAALGRACLVGGTTYLLERAERAEAEFAMARTDADQLRVDLRKAETALAVAEKAQRHEAVARAAITEWEASQK